MSGAQYGWDIMEPLCRRIHNGEAKTHLEAETGIGADTLLKYYRKWCRENNLSETRHIHKGSSQSFVVVSSKPEPKPKINVPPTKIGKRIAVIPDMQVKPGIDLAYCSHIGKYMAHKKPDIIVCGGDFADMPSLSTHDPVGCKRMEGARYEDDILSVQTAMRLMMTPIKEESEKSGWTPRLVMLHGNHEDRIRRAVESTPKLEGKIGLCDLHYEEWGWEVHPFLEPVVIEGIVFSHYFCSGVMGKPITSARALLSKKHMSCFAFHQQGRDIAFGMRADGRQMIAILAGSCYEHEEHFLNLQTNIHWRGLYILNDVVDGAFEENAVSLKYLRRRYE